LAGGGQGVVDSDSPLHSESVVRAPEDGGWSLSDQSTGVSEADWSENTLTPPALVVPCQSVVEAPPSFRKIVKQIIVSKYLDSGGAESLTTADRTADDDFEDISEQLGEDSMDYVDRFVTTA
jgi:hypothetical protein